MLFQFSGPQQKCGFGCACVLCLPRPQGLWHTLRGCGAPFPSAASGPVNQRLGRTFPGCGTPFPSVASAQAACRVPAACICSEELASSCDPEADSQELFRQEPRPVCSVGGGGFSGAEFAPFPSPLLPTSSGDGPAVWSFSVPLFCEPTAVCSGRLTFFLLSHSLKKPPPTALRAFGRSLP